MKRCCSIIALFFFAVGVVGANTFLSQEAFLTGYLAAEYMSEFQRQASDGADIFLFALKYRCSIWLSLLIGGAFRIGSFLACTFCAGFGFAIGFLLTAWIRQGGMAGIFYMLALGMPQMLFYLPAVGILLTRICVPQKEKKSYWITGILLSGLFLLGIFSEYYWNPWMLEKL